VEKTCANCLRVSFVDAILPEATYVYIRRDALDAVASTRARWTGSNELAYVLRKARVVPPTDLPHYGLRYLRARLARLRSPERRVPTWGPVFAGLPKLARDRPLEEVCAHQWRACVTAAEAALAALPEARVLRVRYETFVADPRAALGELLDGLGVAATRAAIEQAVAPVSPGSVGRGAHAFTADERARVRAVVADVGDGAGNGTGNGP